MTEYKHWSADPANKEKLAAAIAKGVAKRQATGTQPAKSSAPSPKPARPSVMKKWEGVGRPPIPGTPAYARLSTRLKQSATARFRHAQRKANGLPALSVPGTKDAIRPLDLIRPKASGRQRGPYNKKRGPYKKKQKVAKKAWIARMLATRAANAIARTETRAPLNGHHAPTVTKFNRGFAKETVQGFAIVGAKQALAELDEKRETLRVFIEKMEHFAHAKR